MVSYQSITTSFLDHFGDQHIYIYREQSIDYNTF